MIDLASLPLVSQTSRQTTDQSVAAVGGLQQDRAAIGTALLLIELQYRGLGENLGEQQTLCRAIVKHGKPLLLPQTLSQQHVCSRRGFSCLQRRE
jgi:hypothetical protein